MHLWRLRSCRICSRQAGEPVIWFQSEATGLRARRIQWYKFQSKPGGRWRPEYSLEGLMLKLKLQYFSHLMQSTDSLEKTLMLGKIESRKRRGQKDEMVGWHYQLDGHEFEQALGVDVAQGSLVCCGPWGRKELDTTERLNWNWRSISQLADCKQKEWMLLYSVLFVLFRSPNWLNKAHSLGEGKLLYPNANRLFLFGTSLLFHVHF